MFRIENLLLAHHAPENHPAHAAVLRFVDAVSLRSNGRLQITVVPDSVLGHLPSLIQLVVSGQLDMALPPFDRMATHIDKFSCLGLPFIFQNARHVDSFLAHHLQPWVAPELDELGIECISAWEWGFRQITNARRPILTPEDMKGLKIRVPPTPQYINAIKALGAQPVVSEFSRLNDFMQKGLVDGQENPVCVIHSQFLETTQRYLSMLNYCYGATTHIANHARMQKLAPELQAIIREESSKAGQWMREYCRAEEAGQLASLAASGMQIDTPDIAPFQQALRPLESQLAAQLGEVALAYFLAMVEVARKDNQ